ncbi:multiubiquitin domain-containing protein [Bradyrhizobium sp. SBR1B]|uniref:multiubiquitin domain-containing protein n=1 Tax=Bradyrhizobium sp. SBR1B TaxID=2663836 RepID=UPI0016066E0E|nr:multiubiquitin domain-containing protein [Bradyrhizobium sp. SBR1B]MBB4383264.1 hypothetical protein [Bradyrhizobium sp. SBR1B]
MSEAEAENKHLVRIHLDRQTFESPNPTTGAALYELGDVGPHKKLFREVEGNHDDEFIPREDEQVHLKEDDHFYSQKATTIFVNGTPEAWPHRKISYEQAVKLAFPHGPTGGNIRYSVSWTKPDGQEGSLRQGQSVAVVEEMMFDVRNTDKS